MNDVAHVKRQQLGQRYAYSKSPPKVVVDQKV